MKSSIIEKSKSFIRERFDNGDTSKLHYHNWNHTLSVYDSAMVIAGNSGFDMRDTEAIGIAAIFHDIGYLNGWENHEEEGAGIAADFLKGEDYPQQRIEQVKGMIRATRINAIPTSVMEEVIKDADLAHLGMDDYYTHYTNMLREMRDMKHMNISDKEWCAKSLDFMHNQKYYSEQGIKMYRETKNKNIINLRKKMETIGKKEKVKKGGKKKKKLDKSNIPEKGIETLFRVTLRNHMNLSRIADNKANTLISVNAIIISIVLSTLFPKLDSNPFLIYPGFILLAFCIITIIISIFSTIPKTTHGKISRDSIIKKEGNLIFFGNFHAMSLEDFEWAINEVMNDKEYLYKNLTRDLYFLGIVLNRKYRLLRYSYFSFMLGLLISIALFVLSLYFIK